MTWIWSLMKRSCRLARSADSSPAWYARRGHALLGQGVRELLGALAGHAVDDAALAPMLGEDRLDLLERRRARDDPVREVRAIEAREMDPRLLHPEERDDIIADAGGRGGGERDDRYAREALAQDGELAILLPEIVAPFRDAVGLVDGDEADVPRLQGREHLLGHEAFRRR